MVEPILMAPLLILLLASALAAACGLPAVNRRLTVTQAARLLALAPLSAFGLLLWWTAALGSGPAFAWSFEWIPSLGVRIGFHFDALSALFGLLITAIGTLVVLYAGSYLQGQARPWGGWRFLCYLLLFSAAMLGVVLAGDVISLFLFWEGTSVTSFLLIGYDSHDPAARRGAFKSLLLTGGGGIALLLGLLLSSYVAGGNDWATLLAGRDALRSSPLYPYTLGLIALAAFTKSAQVPFHVWLPSAMTAPTPASAYLHSATMVKAGVYVLARLNPALGFTDLWFWLLSSVGLVSMLTGAYLGFKQNDLKALLAYSTIGQLGVLVTLIGQDTEIAFKALVIGILAHALYKSSLFLVAGNVDHGSGTRDLRRLGGLARAMPITFVVGGAAALSMAGLPPLFGFLAKETLLATATHPGVPKVVDWIFPAVAAVAGALVLAQAAMLIWETFLGKRRDRSLHPHEAPPAMLVAAAVPALLPLAVGLLPEPAWLARFLASAAGCVYDAPVKVSLALWTGISVPLLLSGVAISLGVGLFLARRPIRSLMERAGGHWNLDGVYAGALRLLDRVALAATRLQSGKLRAYLAVVLLGILALVVGWGGLARWAGLADLTLPGLDLGGELAVLRVSALLITVTAAVATTVLRRDFSAIIALGASGLGVALLMALEPDPDVALVQVVVDMLTMVVLVLALTRLPRRQRRRAWVLTFRQSRAGLARDLLVALGSGAVVALLTLEALTSRPRASLLTPFFDAGAKVLTGATDIVGAIIVDFRALDTLVEILVLGMAGLGVAALLRYAARHETLQAAGERPHRAGRALPTLGIGGPRTSPSVHALAYVSLPVSMVIAVVHILYGHDQPGDGFTAGVIVSLALGFWYVVFGNQQVRQRLNWLRPATFIGGGILLAVLTATAAAFITGSFLGHVDFGRRLALPLPYGVSLSSSLLFEVAICLVVLGSCTYMLDTLGHPGERGKDRWNC